MHDPQVSVIVPVRDREDLLERTLDALSQQTIDHHEVIVVDDGSTDASRAIAEDRAAMDARITVLDGGGRGAVAARALGVAAARADILAFTDSDCRPMDTWLENGVRHVRAGADVVQGRTEPTRPIQTMERSVRMTRDLGLFPTCNVFYRRSAFESAGGFDAAAGGRWGFRPGNTMRGLGFGEDTLLGWRVRRAGIHRFADDAIVLHHVFPPDARDSLLRATNAGGFAWLVREIPELRGSFLRHSYFLVNMRRIPLYLALLAAVAGQRRVGAVAIAVWAGATARALGHSNGSRPRKIASIPIALAADAITAGSLIAGSVRARRPVL